MSMRAVIVEPKSLHTTTLVFLHGLGDNGYGWASILRRMVPPHCRLVCPHAPTLPLTVYGGERMPAWFDVLARSPASAVQDPASVVRARAQLEELLAEEAAVLAKVGGSRRCVLGGFSMGGALALYTGLTSDRCGELAGLIGLSCYLPLPDLLVGQPPPATPRPPVFLAHGEADDVVLPARGESARQLMTQKLGVTDLRFRTYPELGHSSGDQEITDLGEFISTVLPP